MTGFQANAGSEYVPAFLFFDSCGTQRIPTNHNNRRSDQLDTAEPEIFHDIAGTVQIATEKI